MKLTEERKQIAIDNLQKLTGEIGVEKLMELEKLCPSLAHHVCEFGYGGIYDDPTLDFQQRGLITLAILIALGDTHGLRLHFRAAMKSGLTKEQIDAIITHCAGYAGFPRAINAVYTFQEVLAAMKEVEE